MNEKIIKLLQLVLEINENGGLLHFDLNPNSISIPDEKNNFENIVYKLLPYSGLYYNDEFWKDDIEENFAEVTNFLEDMLKLLKE